MKVITIGTLKGGTGKTTTTFNLAGVLAESNKVLIIDADPQCNLTSFAGVNITDQNRKSLKNIFENNHENVLPPEIIIQSPIREISNLDIIPSNIKLTATEIQLVSRAGRERILFNYIDKYKEAFEAYDYIIIDTNPSMGIINQNAFLLADSIILVSDISFNGVQGAELFMYLWEDVRADLRKENNVAALIINNYDKRMNLASELREYCTDDDEFHKILIGTSIPSTVKMKETETAHQPINILYPKSPAHKALLEVVKELNERGII